MAERQFWYVAPVDPSSPGKWRMCRPYWCDDSKTFLTDDEILRLIGPRTLATVREEEAAWQRLHGKEQT